jgi:hypothetical protein
MKILIAYVERIISHSYIMMYVFDNSKGHVNKRMWMLLNGKLEIQRSGKLFSHKKELIIHSLSNHKCLILEVEVEEKEMTEELFMKLVNKHMPELLI